MKHTYRMLCLNHPVVERNNQRPRDIQKILGTKIKRCSLAWLRMRSLPRGAAYPLEVKGNLVNPPLQMEEVLPLMYVVSG